MNSHTHKMRIRWNEDLNCADSVCDCGLALRIATQAEAAHVWDTGATAPDGPLIIANNVVVVPHDYDIWEDSPL